MNKTLTVMMGNNNINAGKIDNFNMKGIDNLSKI